MKKRALSFGINSIFISIVVISIVGVINFLGFEYPQKYDATKNKLHTFSDQSEKVMKSLKDTLDATFYGDLGAKEKYRPIFDSYRKLSPKFKLESVDPNKEPTRAKTAGIKKMETLVLSYRGKIAKVEDITEEKVTNEIIKLTKDSHSVVCTVVGHGEQSFLLATAEGYQAAKKGLEDQTYELKELTLPQVTSIPAECNAVVMLGANKALFPAEIKMLGDYLDQGGRLIIAFEAAITQADQTKELQGLLKNWGVDVKGGLIIDPVSRMLGVDASVPIIAQFNSAVAITKDTKQQSYFPMSRPLEVISPAPEGLHAEWMAKTTEKAMGLNNVKANAKGEVQVDEKSATKGPLVTAAVVSGKKKGSTAAHDTRIVVFGSSQFADNQYSRFGGNLDLFLNSVSWAIEDESMISIRSKEDEAGKLELSRNQQVVIFLIAVILVPLSIAIAGIVIWVRRKKL